MAADAELAAMATDKRLAHHAAQLWRAGGLRAVTFGAVAKEAASGKSLVSHHFPSHRHLLLAAGHLVAGALAEKLEAIAQALQASDRAARQDGPAILIERLLYEDGEQATCLLELCALALSDADFRDMLAPIFAAIARIAALAEADTRLIQIAVLGELLQHAPIPRSPLGPQGLRERMRLFTAPGAQHPELVEGFRSLANARVEKRALAAQDRQDPSPEDRRERIVLAARNLLARGEDPSHRAIAAEAGVSLSATTYYFKSRTDIVIGIYERIQADTREGRAQAAFASVSDTREFIAALRALLPYYPAHPDATVAHLNLVLLAARTPPLRDWADRAQKLEIAGLRQLLARFEPDIGIDLGRTSLSVISGLALDLLLHPPD